MEPKRPRGLEIAQRFTLVATMVVFCVLLHSAAAENSRAQARNAVNSDTAASIVVGPNMLVSRDGDFAHVELTVTANPQHPKNLVSGAITSTRAEGGWACKAYSSQNGGDTWIDAVLPEEHVDGGGDPQVAYGAHGTAYFAALSMVKDDVGRTRSAVLFYRSEDGGTTWKKPTSLGYSYDHDVIAVDHSTGRFAGRIYVSVLYGYPVYRVGVFRSDDDGRTFTGPVEAANGGGTIGINTAANIMVLADGTLIVPYEDFEFLPEKRKDAHTGNFWFVTSSDGGLTFSAPHKIGTQEYDKDPDAPRLTTFPAFAADDTADSQFKGRIYAAWTDFRERKYRIWYSYSADRGNAWTAPKQLDANVPDAVWQFQPMVAVNQEGTVAVTWYDARNSKQNEKFDEYFSASVDGGETFAAPVRISSYSSLLPGNGNLRLDPDAWNYKGEQRLTFLSAAARWGNGGDYMGLTADANGVFHPLWADSRTGTFQIQTARVEVKKPMAATKQPAGQPAAPVADAPRVQTDITGKVELVFDPAKYDGASQEVEIPIRLKNISDGPIFGPIVATVAGFGSGEGEDERENSPEILNAGNLKKGPGATFDFTPVLGSTNLLPANGVSGALVWRLRLMKPLRTPDLHMTLTGFVLQTK